MIITFYLLITFSIPDRDNISTESLKYGGEYLANHIHHLMQLIWAHETILDEWKESIIILLHKKGDKAECRNY